MASPGIIDNLKNLFYGTTSTPLPADAPAPPPITDDGTNWNPPPPTPVTSSAPDSGYWIPKIADSLYQTAKSGLTLPGDVATGKASMNDPATQARVGDMTSLVTLGSGAFPAEADSLNMGIRAYHGTPYDFDKFDISKIGTGEGAQAYGHGLYFAGNEDVAKNYRNQLAPGFVNADGSPLSDAAYSALAFVQPKYEQSGQLAEGIQDAIGRLKTQSDFYRKNYGSGVNLYDNAVDTLQNLDPSTLKPKGHMYQVDINADPEHFLDWDKPLSEQSPHVSDAIADWAAANRVQMGNATGARVYQDMARRAVNGDWGDPGELAHSQASSALRDAGIPGIKYLDQGSRGAGGEGGTQNYVTFSDSIVDILKKYGLAGLGTAGGAAALTAGAQPATPSSGANVAAPFY